MLRMRTHTDAAAAALVRAADADGLSAAVAALASGHLIGLPTETVYGLAGDAYDPQAIRRIFAAKGRPADNPLIVHIAAPEELVRVAARVTPLARRLAATFWPGPLTLVVDASPEVPMVTRAGLSTVAVRLPDHPVAATVIERAPHPLAAPSANRSGRPSPTRATDVVDELGEAVALILDGGPCPVGVESTVVDVRAAVPVVLREGSVTREQLGVEGVRTAGERERSPGTRYRHYAPRCPVELVAPEAMAAVVAALAPEERARTGVVATPRTIAGLPDGPRVVTRFTDEVDLARGLYGALRGAEEAGVARLLVETVPERGVGRAVMDRLRRAAAQP